MYLIAETVSILLWIALIWNISIAPHIYTLRFCPDVPFMCFFFKLIGFQIAEITFKQDNCWPVPLHTIFYLSYLWKALISSTTFHSPWEMLMSHIPSCPIFKLLFWLLGFTGGFGAQLWVLAVVRIENVFLLSLVWNSRYSIMSHQISVKKCILAPKGKINGKIILNLPGKYFFPFNMKTKCRVSWEI